MVGSPIYVAPEVMKSGRYTSKIDSYSFGICLISCSEEGIMKFFLHGLRRSTKKRDLMGIVVHILSNSVHTRGWRPHLPKKLYPSLNKLIRDCWQVSTKRTIVASEATNNIATRRRFASRSQFLTRYIGRRRKATLI